MPAEEQEEGVLKIFVKQFVLQVPEPENSHTFRFIWYALEQDIVPSNTEGKKEVHESSLVSRVIKVEQELSL